MYVALKLLGVSTAECICLRENYVYFFRLVMGEDLGMGKTSQTWKTCCVGCRVMGRGPMIY